jgi:hypothetical protein
MRQIAEKTRPRRCETNSHRTEEGFGAVQSKITWSAFSQVKIQVDETSGLRADIERLEATSDSAQRCF